MATKFPRSSDEFHSITGVGDHKLRKYGDVFLAEIEHYCRDYSLIPAEKPENSGAACKRAEKEEIISKGMAQRNENSETEMEMFGIKMSIPESDKVNSSEVCKFPSKRAKYLDMSIQDWSETDSSEGGSKEINSIESSTQSEIVDLLKTDFSESNSLEIESQQRTFSLFSQGLRIDEIAEIQGMSTRTIFRQLEQLALSGKIQGHWRTFIPGKTTAD